MNTRQTQHATSLAEVIQATPPGMATADQIVAAYESAPDAVQSRMLSELVGEVFEDAPLPVRGMLLEKLLRAVGVTALVSVAGGVFAKISLRHGVLDAPLKLEDVQTIRTSEVLALVDRVQQAGHGAIQGLAQLIAGSPVLASSAAASVLVMVLIRSRGRRRPDDFYA